MSTGTCGQCKYWSFKTSANRSFGRCLNPKVQDSIYISTTKVDLGLVKGIESFNLTGDQMYELIRLVNKEIDEWCELRFEENSFGCIHFEKGDQL